MAEDKRARLKQWLESGEARLHPLAFPQRELWEASCVPVAAKANNICYLINLRGAIAQRDGENAVQTVVNRQDVMRLSFLPGKSGPLQMIRNTMDANFLTKELPSSQASPEAIEEYAATVFAKPFDMLQGPLYRLEMLRISPAEHVIVMSMHHSIGDGWTVGVFVQDLCSAYLQGMMGGGPLPAVPLTYTAWAAAEREIWQPAQLEKCAAFWKPRLAGAPRLWEGVANPPSGASLVRHRHLFSAELGKAARNLARTHGATLFSTLLAVFRIALAQWSGKNDFTVGSPVANRGKHAARETMGYFAGNVPLRGQVDKQMTFSENLRIAHDETMEAFAHAMPFAELMRAVGEAPAPGRHPVYQVRFALQNHPVPDINLPSLSTRMQMRSTGTARFDLGCEVTEMGDELEVVWLFRHELFSPADMENLKDLFQTVLSSVCRSPGSRIAALAS